MAYKITDENYEEIIESYQGPILIDFWANWCGPCKALAKTIDELAKDYVDTVFVCSCDVEENPKMAEKYNIQHLPTVLFIKNNEVKDKQIGLALYNTYAEKLDSLLAE